MPVAKPSSSGIGGVKNVGSISRTADVGNLRVGTNYIEYDLGWDRIVAGTHTLTGETVAAGSIDEVYDSPPQVHPSGILMPTATVGTIHEFGLGQFSAKHFMREAFDMNKAEYVAIAIQAYQGFMVRRNRVRDALIEVGAKMVQDIRDRIDAHDLIDTGQLRASMQFEHTLGRRDG